jgi:hypothetical protein
VYIRKSPGTGEDADMILSRRIAGPFLGLALMGAMWSGGFAMAAEVGVFNVREYGATGDGKTLDTAAINQAIEACAAAGGGKVLLPPGVYLSGTVHLKSNVTFFLDAGARLAGTPDLDAYQGLPGFGRWHHALVTGSKLENVTIAGAGVIDGRKVHDADGEEKMRGPHAIDLSDCRRIVIRDVTITDAANYAVLLLYCSQVDVRNVKFEGGWDGVHFRSRKGTFDKDLNIIGCHFFTGDDSIAGWGMENLLIKDCTINTSCNGIRIIGPVKHMIVDGCLLYGPGVHPHRTQSRHNMLSAINLQPGAWEACEGPLEDVLISNVTIKNVACPINVWLKLPRHTADGITIQNLDATGIYRAAASVESWSETAIGRVVFRDVRMEFEGGGTAAQAGEAAKAPNVDVRLLPAWGIFARNVKDLVLDDVVLSVVKEDARPAVMGVNIERLGVDGLRSPKGAAKDTVVLQGVTRVDRLTEEYVPHE